jgi:HEAT repeat protein
MKKSSFIGLSLLLAISLSNLCKARVDSDREIEALIGQLGADQQTQTEAARQLAGYGTHAVPHLIGALESPDSKIRLAASSVLAMIGEDAVPALLGALKDRNKLVREHSALALNREVFGVEKLTARTISQVVDGLSEALGDPVSEVQRNAVAALGTLEPESARAVPALIALLRKENGSNDEVREAVISTLGKFGSKATDAIPALIESFKYDPEANVTRLAYNMSGASLALSDIGTAALPLLIRALSDSDIRVRCYAADALGFMKTDDAAAVHALTLALGDVNAKSIVRVRAAAAIDNIGIAAHPATPALRTALRDKDEAVRSTAAEAIGKMGQYARDAIPDLIAIVNNSKEYIVVRNSAINALGNLGYNASGATSSLISVLDGPPELREAAYSAVGNVTEDIPPVVWEKLVDTRIEVHLRNLLAVSITKKVERLLEGDVANIPDDKLKKSIANVEQCRAQVAGFGPDYSSLVERLDRSIVSLNREQARRLSDNRRRQAYVVGSVFFGLAVLAFSVLASVNLRRRLLVLLGRRWTITFGQCQALIEITDTTITIRPNVGAEASWSRFPTMWPPTQTVLETVREMLPGANIQVIVDRSLFREPWAYHLGGPWADGPDAAIAGQLCAVPGRSRIRPVYTKAIAFAAFSCSDPENFLPLEAVNGEIDTVTACFSRWGASVYCSQYSASVSSVCKGLMNADVIHVAAHATTAGIVLQDGLLSTTELTNEFVSTLRCRLLVLSGCEAGRLSEDDSFVYTLVQAGVNVIAAVDFVKDQACRTFFEEFYAALLPGRKAEGIELGAAIRKAADACANRFGEVEASLQFHGDVERWKKSVNSFILYGDPTIHLDLQSPKGGKFN